MQTTSPGKNDRLNQFLQEARQAIVLGGGFNASALLRLQMIAQKLGLSDAERDSAIKQLQQARAPESPLARFFREQITPRVKAAGVVAPPFVKKLIDEGQRGGLAPAEIERIVRETAEEQGVPFFSEDDAQTHIRRKIEQMLANGILTRKKLPALHAEAEQFGLAKARVNELITLIQQEQRFRDDAVQRRGGRSVLAGLAVGALVVLAAGIWLTVLLTTPRKNPVAQGELAEPSSPATPTAPSATRSQPQTWGGPEWARAVEALGKTGLLEEPVLARFLDSRAERRKEAFTQLLRTLASYPLREEEKPIVAALVILALRQEPVEDNYAVLAEGLSDLAGLKGKTFPDSRAGYAPGLWALQTLVTAALDAQTPKKRAEALAQAVQTLSAVPLDRTVPLAVSVDRAQLGLVRGHLKKLAGDRALLGTDRALTLLEGLLGQVALAPEQKLELETELLFAALDSGADGLKRYEKLLARCLDAREPRIVEALLKRLQETSEAAVRELLSEGVKSWATRHGVTPAGMTPAELVAAAGQVLKPSRAGTGSRVEKLQARARQLLEATPATPDRRAELFQETVNLAHASTLACALAQKNAGFARFDELLDNPPALNPQLQQRPMVQGGSGVGGMGIPIQPMNFRGGMGQVGVAGNLGAFGGQPMNFRGGMGQVGALGNFGQQGAFGGQPARPPRGRPNPPIQPPQVGASAKELLKELTSGKPQARIQAYQLLANMLVQQELEPAQARVLAGYVLATPKTPQEWTEVLSHVSSLAASRNTVLALADYFDSPRVNQATSEKLVSAILGREIKLGKVATWWKSCQALLLQFVLDQMDASGDAADKAADTMRKLYKEQAFLLGIDAPRFLLLTEPSQHLEVLITFLGERLSKEKLDAKLRTIVEQVPHEVAVAQFITSNDLQRMVLYQRCWLKMLSAFVVHQKPDTADAAQKLIDALAEEDRKATNLLAQLRSGEEKILRLWLLLHAIR